MDILQISGIAISGILLLSIVRSFKPEFAIYIVLGIVIIILYLSFDMLSSVFQFLKNVYDRMNYGKEYFPIIIKVLIVAYLADFTSQLCIDAGESSIGNKVELAGKIIIFYISLPILVSILDIIDNLL